MMAMIKLWKSEVLKGLGWKLLLQIHDEVILEGPKESLDEVRFSLVDIFPICACVYVCVEQQPVFALNLLCNESVLLS